MTIIYLRMLIPWHSRKVCDLTTCPSWAQISCALQLWGRPIRHKKHISGLTQALAVYGCSEKLKEGRKQTIIITLLLLLLGESILNYAMNILPFA